MKEHTSSWQPTRPLKICIPKSSLLFIASTPYLLKKLKCAKMHVFFMGFVNFIWSIYFWCVSILGAIQLGIHRWKKYLYQTRFDICGFLRKAHHLEFLVYLHPQLVRSRGLGCWLFGGHIPLNFWNLCTNVFLISFVISLIPHLPFGFGK